MSFDVGFRSCRRHRCPHNPRAGFASPSKEPCTFSEYANTYRQHPVERRKNYKPVEQPVKAEGPMDGWTTSRQMMLSIYLFILVANLLDMPLFAAFAGPTHPAWARDDVDHQGSDCTEQLFQCTKNSRLAFFENILDENTIKQSCKIKWKVLTPLNCISNCILFYICTITFSVRINSVSESWYLVVKLYS